MKTLNLPFVVIAGLVAGATALAPIGAQTPEIDLVLDRTGDYVTSYTRAFVGVVAEETYRQEVRGRSGTDGRGFTTEGSSQRRDLKSDVLLVRAPAGDRWIQFRDVFEVDGKPVRDRAERLEKLFLQPSSSRDRQIEDITAASARYNIGGVNRNVNLPVLALTILEPINRAWFAFRGSRKSATRWELEYQEDRGGTLIRTSGGQAMPSHGHFSVESETGRVLSSELIAESVDLRAQIDVTYAQEPAVGMLVPHEMREKYKPRQGPEIEGRASYAKFRRYQVTVDETLKK
jgi:hypothetical protein